MNQVMAFLMVITISLLGACGAPASDDMERNSAEILEVTGESSAEDTSADPSNNDATRSEDDFEIVPALLGGRCRVYSGANYTGRVYEIWGPIGDLSGHYIGNDAIVSIRCDLGTRLQVYEHTYFQGQNTWFMRDSDLRNDGWAYRISSVALR